MPSRSRAFALFVVLAFAGAAGLLAWGLAREDRSMTVESAPPDWLALIKQVDPSFTASAGATDAGEELSRAHCGTCHLRPEPSVLARHSWLEVLTHHAIIVGGQAIPDPAALSLPAEPLRTYRIPGAELSNIMAFYLAKAPLKLPEAEQRAYGPEAPFEARYAEVSDPARPAMYALAASLRNGERIVLGEVVTQSLVVHDAGGQERHRIAVPGVATGILETGGKLVVTLIGPQPYTTNEAQGKVLELPAGALDAPGAPFKELLAGLRRPVHTLPANLDGDPQLELLVEEFGFSDGSLGYYDLVPGGGYQHRKLLDMSGTVSAHAGDFNGDGNTDVVGLVAQASEAAYVMWGRGEGNFEQELLLQNHPAFGANQLLLADLNGDRHPDLVVINGDRMDLPSRPMSPDSGVHVYLNDGRFKFSHGYFYPLIGAVQGVARDLDGDGDTDIVAVSATPDFDRQPFETAIYLENMGDMNFRPRRIPGAERGCWSAIDAGDFDRDGDLDLVMAAAYLPIFGSQIQRVFGPTPPLSMAIFVNENSGRENAK